MKNQNIENLSQPIPLELRLEIYKEALDCINSKNDLADCAPISYPLCIILPILLWGLKSMNNSSPNGEKWTTKDSPIAFPELKEFVKGLSYFGIRTNPERIKFLEDTIKSLTK